MFGAQPGVLCKDALGSARRAVGAVGQGAEKWSGNWPESSCEDGRSKTLTVEKSIRSITALSPPKPRFLLL